MIRDSQQWADRTVWGIMLWLAGLIAMQLAGPGTRTGVFRFGQAISLFTGATAVILIVLIGGTAALPVLAPLQGHVPGFAIDKAAASKGSQTDQDLCELMLLDGNQVKGGDLVDFHLSVLDVFTDMNQITPFDASVDSPLSAGATHTEEQVAAASDWLTERMRLIINNINLAGGSTDPTVAVEPEDNNPNPPAPGLENNLGCCEGADNETISDEELIGTGIAAALLR